MRKNIIQAILICVLLLTFLPFSDNVYAATKKTIPMVTAGYHFSAVLKEDGTVWCFGLNESGQLGNASAGSQSEPVKVSGLSNVISIASADDYTLALKNDGTVWGWGNNYESELGDGKPLFCIYASKIQGIGKIKAIAAGNGMSVFIKTDGTVLSILWEGNKSVINNLANLKDITAVACRNTCAIALDKNGAVWTWQWDYTLKNDGIVVTEPVQVNITEVKSIAVGAYHYIALKQDGTVWIWGMNNQGQIGDGTKDWCYTPKKLENVAEVQSIAAGAYDSMAVLKDGTYLVWGDNEDGQYGNGTEESSLTPMKVDNLAGVIFMDGGYEHTIVLKADGDVMVMGSNTDGMLGIKDGVDKLSPYKIMNVKDADPGTDQGVIYPDGSLKDWNKTKPVAVAAKSSSNTELVGIKALYAKMDQEYLYLAATVTQNIPADVIFCLDTDGDQEQEYTVHFQNNLFADTFLSDIDNGFCKEIYGVFGDVVEIRIPLTDLGSPSAINVKAEYGGDKVKYAVNAEILSWNAVMEANKSAE